VLVCRRPRCPSVLACSLGTIQYINCKEITNHRHNHATIVAAAAAAAAAIAAACCPGGGAVDIPRCVVVVVVLVRGIRDGK
jgi:hypothetical protein